MKQLPTKYRVILWPDCPRSCEYCCNKQYNLQELPILDILGDLDHITEIILTGGEPLLYPEVLWYIIDKIGLRLQGRTPIYVYTTLMHPDAFVHTLYRVDGITLTLHDNADIASFHELQHYIKTYDIEGKTLRLNVMPGVTNRFITGDYWKVKKMSILDECPVPEGETLVRLGL